MSNNANDLVKINALKVDAIYNNASIPVIVMLVGALGLIITLWDARNTYAILSWFTALVVITLIRYLIFLRYKKTHKEPEHYTYWLNTFIYGAIVSASVWGTTAYILPVNNNVIDLGLITMFMLIIAAGAIGIYSVYRRVYYASCLPAIVPLILFLLYQDNEQLNKLGNITIIFSMCIFVMQYHSHRIMNQLIISKYDNKSLLNNYERDQARINVLELLNNARKKELEILTEQLKSSNALIKDLQDVNF